MADMTMIKKLVTQTGNDTFTSLAIDTNLTVDGKAGWLISAIEASWVDGAAVAAGDWTLNAIVATVATATTFADDAEIARLSWGLQNTGGVAVSVPYEPQKAYGLLVPRLTVAPFIYLNVQSTATGQANDVVFKVYYEIEKVSELELLRLRAVGG